MLWCYVRRNADDYRHSHNRFFGTFAGTGGCSGASTSACRPPSRSAAQTDSDSFCASSPSGSTTEASYSWANSAGSSAADAHHASVHSPDCSASEADPACARSPGSASSSTACAGHTTSARYSASRTHFVGTAPAGGSAGEAESGASNAARDSTAIADSSAGSTAAWEDPNGSRTVDSISRSIWVHARAVCACGNSVCQSSSQTGVSAGSRRGRYAYTDTRFPFASCRFQRERAQPRPRAGCAPIHTIYKSAPKPSACPTATTAAAVATSTSSATCATACGRARSLPGCAVGGSLRDVAGSVAG